MLLEGKKKQEDLEKIKKKIMFHGFFYHKFHIFHK